MNINSWFHVEDVTWAVTDLTHVRLSACYYNDVIMGDIASQITSLTIVYSTVYSDADQRKHQSSASLAFVRGIHRWPVNSRHKWPVKRKMFPFDDVIMGISNYRQLFVQQFVRANSEGNMKVPNYWPLYEGIHQMTSRYPLKKPVMRRAFTCIDVMV